MIKCKDVDEKGFTLVELSIVLVIIGLLIGGILVAQSMISTTKVQATIRQFQQFDIAIANFQTKYNQLPGDSNLFPGISSPPTICSGSSNLPCSGSGNNDGVIHGGPSTANPIEAGLFWNHLSLGVGLKNINGADYQAFDVSQPSIVPNVTCPVLKIASETKEPVCLTVDSNTYNYRPHTNAVNFVPPSTGFGQLYDAVRPMDVLAIETKIDDGLPNTGSIYAATLGLNYIDGQGYGYINQCRAEGYDTGGGWVGNVNATYSKTSQVFGCSLYISLGITGNRTN